VMVMTERFLRDLTNPCNSPARQSLVQAVPWPGRSESWCPNRTAPMRKPGPLPTDRFASRANDCRGAGRRPEPGILTLFFRFLQTG
jgi:hypothetical protein